MKRLLNILVFFVLPFVAMAQLDTRVVDSLEAVLPNQEGRDKVLTMIELTWEFYDVSYDDCLDWGEQAIQEAHNQGLADLEAKANYVLGIQYAYHGDLDLAKYYLQQSYTRFSELGDTKNAFEALWNLATYEFALGSIDTAYQVYEKAEVLAKRLNDTSALAYVLSNMGTIWYKRNDLDQSLKYNREAKKLFESVGDDHRACRMESNIAVVYMERDLVEEARKIYWKVYPRFEEHGDNYYAFLAYKNLGTIYENSIIDYDSAIYYLQKAIACGGKPRPYMENEVFLSKEKSTAYVELGNIMAKRGEWEEAIATYKEALALAESNGYYSGQMEACVGLVKVYSQLGQAANSMGYYQRYSEMEKASGITHMRPSLTKSLVADYARLGRFDEMDAALDDFEERQAALSRELADLYERNFDLENMASDLLEHSDSQNKQLGQLQSQRNQYRLAFFGLLAIVLFALTLLAAYKIVRKNRAKNPND